MTELLQRTHVAVEDVGEQVVLRLGNFEKTLDFVSALELAAMIKREARYAKACAGVDSFRRNCAAVLHDASAERKQSPRRRALPEKLQLKQLRVRAQGRQVTVQLGRTAIGIPFESAPTIAQWLRIRGKMARNTAKEHAHWSELVRPEVLEARA